MEKQNSALLIIIMLDSGSVCLAMCSHTHFTKATLLLRLAILLKHNRKRTTMLALAYTSA